MPRPPKKFASGRDGRQQVVKITVRSGMARDKVRATVEALGGVDWSKLHHAYGSAGDVPALLFAVDVSTDEVRSRAWWELWGNIHHQGTVYEATPAAVPFIDAVARDRDHPDRVEALSFLREISIGDGPYAAVVRDGVRPYAAALVEAWPREPERVQRALIWLAAAFPELVDQCGGLIAKIPESLVLAWREQLQERHLREVGDDTALEARYADHAASDRQHELERWALAGWPGISNDV